MMTSHNAVTTAKSLVEITKRYLAEIQSNEEWFTLSQSYMDGQSQITKQFQTINLDGLSVAEKNDFIEQLRICYQLELQINQLIAQQKNYVASEIAQIKKSNQFKNKYEGYISEPGIMLDTYN